MGVRRGASPCGGVAFPTLRSSGAGSGGLRPPSHEDPGEQSTAGELGCAGGSIQCQSLSRALLSTPPIVFARNGGEDVHLILRNALPTIATGLPDKNVGG